jgi:hypothetical protein
MKTLILAGAAILLAGCAATKPEPTPVPAKAITKVPTKSACTRGAIDAQRSFIICPVGIDYEAEAQLSLKQPADLSLDIARVASTYGIARQTVTGIESATYVRIVGKTPETKPRDERGNTETITIEGRDFRKVTLNADNQEPAVLFIER